ncbi:MAG TPA: hypothetical protein VEK78_12535 [Gemmatimonadales bacterium]|nr:hypothetical protein [Gemmatimonadales bacterium]
MASASTLIHATQDALRALSAKAGDLNVPKKAASFADAYGVWVMLGLCGAIAMLGLIWQIASR